MKKRILHIYDKIIIAGILGVLTLFGCGRKNYPVKEQEQAVLKKRQQDSLRTVDSVILVSPGKFDKNPIVMYGVRPTENIK